MRAPALVLLVTSLSLLAGCHARPLAVKQETVIVHAAATASTPAAPPPPPVRATSAEPLLAMALEGGRVAIFLEPEERSSAPDAGALTLYAREPIIAVGVPLDAASLSPAARAHVEAAYTIRDARGQSCEGTADGFAVLHRIPATDPTVGMREAEAETEQAWTARVFATADQPSRVALVRAAGCKGAVWAVPKSQPPPTSLAVTPASKDVAARTRAVVIKHEGYADLKKKRPTFAYATLGDALVWARAKDPAYGGMSACFLVTREAKPRVLAASPGCPPGVRDASRDATRTFVWFDEAVATVKNDVIDVTYFPTADFGIAEGGP